MSVPHQYDPARRRVLRASGLAGLVMAGTAASATPAQAATPQEDTRHVSTVPALRGLDPAKLKDGALALVTGYHAAGDGGGMALRWAADSERDHNGGTVIAPSRHRGPGRWLQTHTGTVDLRTFGHLDAERPADSALGALLKDEHVHRIQVRTDLLLRKRHIIRRSRLTLDFGGNRLLTKGIERNSDDNPFGAVLFFQGTRTGTTHEHTLGARLPDLSDLVEVGDSGRFTVGQWWALESDAGDGRYEKEIQRLVQITDIPDGSHVRINYKTGWELAAGRTLTWTRIKPVERCHVRDMVFEGAGDDQYTGSHPVAYEYAVRCDVSGIEATGTFWPVVMRRWCTHYRTDRCSLANPKSVTYGGAGYLTQQIYCLYGHIEDCHTSNARHLNDFTACAWSYVTNCHGDGDDQGPFVTHGQFEHDLVYTGNSGLMTFANSGPAWGGAAKRITVRRHSCSWFVARVKVTELTLEDVTVVGKKSLADSGMLWVNADGVQLRGCTASGPLILSQASALSERPNVIADSAFSYAKGAEITKGDVRADVTLLRTTLDGLDGAAFGGTGALVVEQCSLNGAGDTAAPVTVAHTRAVLDGGTLRDTGLKLTGAKDQHLRLTGTTLTGGNAAGALLSRTAGERTVTWHLDAADFTTTGKTAHLLLTDGPNRYRATGSSFHGGRLDLRPAAFAGSGSYLLHTGCTEDGTERAAMPDEGDRVAHKTGNVRF